MEYGLAEGMYREHILELFKHPHNFGKLASPTHACQEYNPLCGDEVAIELKVRDGKISDAHFVGNGCAISIASASILTDDIKGKSVKDVIAMSAQDFMGLLQVPLSPVRMKCALLCLEAGQKALLNGKSQGEIPTKM